MAEDKGRIETGNQEDWEDDDENSQKDKFLTFKIADEEYGIPIQHIIEIVNIQRITEVPDMPDFVKGVINLRGQVIPVMDVRIRFHLSPKEYDDRTCVIVTQVNDVTIGLVVDTVREVVNIPESNITPAPKFTNKAAGRYIMGMGKIEEAVKILLDVTKLLYEEELEMLASAS